MPDEDIIINRTCNAIQDITGEADDAIITMAVIFAAGLQCAMRAPEWAMAFLAETFALGEGVRESCTGLAEQLVEAIPMEHIDA